MMFLYNLLLNVLFILLLPFLPFAFIFVKKLRRGIGERLGIINKETLNKIKGRSIIWFHAASVGETQALLPVISAVSIMTTKAFIYWN